MSLLFNMLTRLVITFLPKSKRLLISWLQSPSAVILEPPKIKSTTVSPVSPSISHEVMGPDAMILVFWMLNFKPIFHSPLLLSLRGSLVLLHFPSYPWCFLLVNFHPLLPTLFLGYKMPPIRLLRWLSGKESACQCRRHRFNPWVRKISWRRKWQPTPVLLPGESMDRGA